MEQSVIVLNPDGTKEYTTMDIPKPEPEPEPEPEPTAGELMDILLGVTSNG